MQSWAAVIKSKLLYGLEGVQITKPQLSKMQTPHLKGFRQILEITTTYVDRAHTHAYVYAKAAEALAALRGARGEEAPRPIRQLRDVLRDRNIKFLGHLLRQNNTDPMLDCAFFP